MDGTILVADDDRTIRTVLTQALTRSGCKVHATSSMITLMRWVDEGKGDLVISDVVMPDGNGIEALPVIAKARPNLPVIVISAQNTITTAIQATENNAYDYLPKPFDLPDLMKRAARALETNRKTVRPKAPAREASQDLPLVGRTAVMQELYRLVARIMNADLSVMITGESGTGKSLIAKAIHDFSDRRSLPYVVATASELSAIDGPTSVLSRARGGSILFDEVGDLDEITQSRLVRMLDAFGENAPRIMAASQADLGKLMEEGRLREDLYYRLGGVSLKVPALRERVDDIQLLCDFFLSQIESEGLPARSFSPEAMNLLRSYSWPGNVRQLQNTLRQLVAIAAQPVVTLSEVEMVLGNQPASERLVSALDADRLSASVARHLRRYFDLHAGELPPPGVYQRILREVEAPLIEIALDATAGNQAKCADLLGINRNTLRKKITELDIRVTRRRRLM